MLTINTGTSVSKISIIALNSTVLASLITVRVTSKSEKGEKGEKYLFLNGLTSLLLLKAANSPY